MVGHASVRRRWHLPLCQVTDPRLIAARPLCACTAPSARACWRRPSASRRRCASWQGADHSAALAGFSLCESAMSTTKSPRSTDVSGSSGTRPRNPLHLRATSTGTLTVAAVACAARRRPRRRGRPRRKSSAGRRRRRLRSFAPRPRLRRRCAPSRPKRRPRRRRSAKRRPRALPRLHAKQRPSVRPLRRLHGWPRRRRRRLSARLPSRPRELLKRWVTSLVRHCARAVLSVSALHAGTAGR